MSFKKRSARGFTLFVMCVTAAAVQVVSAQTKPSEVELMGAEELKRKVDGNEPVTIIDVRATDSFLDSGGKIKGAIHVKPRRLKARLAMPPLKDIPRDREVVTYCACPADEASIRAAQVLSAAGFKRVRVLKGGWQAWLSTRGQVENKPRGT